MDKIFEVEVEQRSVGYTKVFARDEAHAMAKAKYLIENGKGSIEWEQATDENASGARMVTPEDTRNVHEAEDNEQAYKQIKEEE